MDTPVSNEEFLQIATDCGAIQAGYVDGLEVPYAGVHAQAAELVQAGSLTVWPDNPIPDSTVWLPTAA